MAQIGERVTKLEQAMAGMAEADKELRRAIADGWRQIEKTDRQIAESRAEADRKMGELSNKLGNLVEDIVAPSIPTLFRELFGAQDLDMSAEHLRRRHRLDPGRMREFDYVAMAGQIVLVNETKSSLRPEHIHSFVATLSEIRQYLPDAEGRDVIGSLASFSLDPSFVVAGERQGLLMFGLGTGLLRVLNSPDFKPRRF